MPEMKPGDRSLVRGALPLHIVVCLEKPGLGQERDCKAVCSIRSD